MVDEPRPADSELSVSSDGVRLRGNAYEDMRPALREGGKALGQIVQLIGNIIGIPLDWANHNLEGLRRRYAQKVGRIPLDQRQMPPLRLGSAVVRNAAVSAEEDVLQDMFAELLAAASDTGRAAGTRASFASIIQELEPSEADVVKRLARSRWNHVSVFDLYPLFGDPKHGEHPNTEAAIGNLVRLGIVEWHSDVLHEQERALRDSGRRIGESHGPASKGDVSAAVHHLRNAVRDALKEKPRRHAIRLTALGRQFASSCVPQAEGSEGTAG